MTPNPRNFRSLTDYRAAQQAQQDEQQARRQERRLILCACLCSAFLLCLINWPGITLACLCVGLCIAAIAGGLWLEQARKDGKEYDAEYDLP